MKDPDQEAEVMYALLGMRACLRASGTADAVALGVAKGIRSNSFLAFQYACSLAQGLPEADALTLPALCDVLESGDPQRTWWVLHTLGRMGSRATTALPKVLSRLDRISEGTVDAVHDAPKIMDYLGAVYQIGIQDESEANIVGRFIVSGIPELRELAAQILLQYNPEDPRAVAVVEQCLTADSRERRLAMLLYLLELRSIPEAVRPLLREMLNDGDKEVRALAEIAQTRFDRSSGSLEPSSVDSRRKNTTPPVE